MHGQAHITWCTPTPHDVYWYVHPHHTTWCIHAHHTTWCIHAHHTTWCVHSHHMTWCHTTRPGVHQHHMTRCTYTHTLLLRCTVSLFPGLSSTTTLATHSPSLALIRSHTLTKRACKESSNK